MFLLRRLAVLLLILSASPLYANDPPELLIYGGITMVRPISELAQNFEKTERVKIRISQGGSEDLYQSAKLSRQGDLYLHGEPSYRELYLAEGLLGDYAIIGYNRMAMMVAKGNPHAVKSEPTELLRPELDVIIGNAKSGSVGKETESILKALGIYAQVLDRAIYLAPDSRALMTAMKRGEADVIMNWRAVGFFPDNAPFIDVIDLDPRLAKPEALLLTQLVFSKHPQLARKFMSYAASPEGQAIIRKYGFFDNRTVLPEHSGSIGHD